MSNRLHVATLGCVAIAIVAALAIGFHTRVTEPSTFTRKAYVWECSSMGRMHPAELDNRSLIGPILDQKGTEDCAYFAWAGYITARCWQLYGEIKPTDPKALRAALSDTRRRSGHHANASQPEGTICPSCMRKTVAQILGIPPDTARHFAAQKDPAESIYRTKRLLHRYGYIVAHFDTRCGWRDEPLDKGAYIIPCGGCECVIPHVAIICGYTAEGFIVANSWGRSWGAKGFAVLTYEDFADQFRAAHYFVESTTPDNPTRKQK